MMIRKIEIFIISGSTVTDGAQGAHSTVTLTLDSLKLEPRTSGSKRCYDWVKVFDGCDSDTSKLKATLCGSETFEPITSTGRCLYVAYRTDNGATAKGFAASYKINKASGDGALTADARMGKVFERIAAKMQETQSKVASLTEAHTATLAKITDAEKNGAAAGPPGSPGATGVAGATGAQGAQK